MNIQRYRRLGAALAALAVLGAPAAATLARPGTAAAAPNCAEPGSTGKQANWARPALALDRVAPLSGGSGQRVAVLSTGVDGNHAQLKGRVEAGSSVLPGAPGAGNTDCSGLGTQVAGVIAGGQLGDTGVIGVAPNARIVPIRVADQRAGGEVAPAVLAAGINAAVTAKVDVICVPLVAYTDSEELEAAVRAALAAGIPVVASAGDPPGQDNPKPYPASSPGVIAVTALNVSGAVVQRSGSGDYVSLGAPGAGVVTLQTGSGLVVVDGTGLAAGYVAGAVALVRSRSAKLSPDAIERQLTATATPTQPTSRNKALAGMVNPYRALTETLVQTSGVPVPGYDPPPAPAVDAAKARARDRALLLAAGALGLAVLVGMVAVGIRTRRRHSWRPMLAPPPMEPNDSPEPLPPVLLFEDQK
ncbi:S8 family serine peptidase [Dactylosporangium sp. CA-139066]|uniref:S8 family serine peptidase n=1 Tax=Dactylosporangium sp. CA-139066 TaxID=3239930 RepID=UPI003D94ACE2